MRRTFRIWLVVLLSMSGGLAWGQQAREVFGKNRIQYKQFNWTYISSENFDLYYYDDRRRLATEAIQYLESEFDRITDLIGWTPYLKTKVFLYNSITDLQQSNMGLNRNPYTMGGQTDFIKPYVEIAHPGTTAGFKEELLYKVADLMVNEMMFGGSLAQMFQSSVLLNLPDWFINGASAYAAKGWTEEMDDYVRQFVRSKKVGKALSTSGNDATMIGQSIWNYIVEKYGKSSVSNILNYTRVIRNEQKSVLITLNISFKQLMNDWRNYYQGMEQRVSQDYHFAADSNRFTPRHRPSFRYPTMKISPDGKKIAYAENDRGKYTVKVKSLENGRETIILNGGNFVIRQAIDYRMPLMSWADANTLGVIAVEKGQYIFWLYDLTTRTKLPRPLEKFNNVRSFNFSGNGRLAVLSADLEGQNDLYLVSSRRDRIKRLTNDLFDDLDPSFIPNSNSLVFSSNRSTDTLNVVQRGMEKVSANDYNLFVFDLDTTRNTVKRITNSLGRDFYPYAQDANTFYYLSDQRGITNIFRFDLSTGIYTQVTNYASGIREFDLDFTSHLLSFVATKRMSEDIFVVPNFDYTKHVFTPLTRRKELLQARTIGEKKKKEIIKGVSLKQLINTRLQEKKDTTAVEQPVPKQQEPKEKPRTLKDLVNARRDSVQQQSNVINTDNYTFDDAPPRKDSVATPVQEKSQVNTSDYKFEDEATQTQQPSESFLVRYMKARETSRLTGPFPYQPKFSYENLSTTMVIDPLRSYSMRLETQMNDMLENYRISGGLQTAFDWKSGDAWGEFQYLPHRVDYSVRFERKVIFWSQPTTGNQEKYSWQKIEFGGALPISVRTRLSLKPFLGYTRFVDRGNENNLPVSGGPQFMPTKEQVYAGAKIELVYDNSLTTGLNIIEGTRAKMVMNHYEAMGSKQLSFSQVFADVRHYQKLYKEIVLAFRGYAGTFFGNSPKKYLLGGMDNWFGNQTNHEGIGNPLIRNAGYNQDLLFVEFATGLRGFDYGKLYGNSVMLGNAELRVPVVRALAGGPIASNFFRNMQLTAFYDIGTSWTGTPPFGTTNSVPTRIVPENNTNNPFQVEVKEYLNPWLYSYGCGFRTVMFGYYLKFDLAWPVINYKVQDPRLQVSLGFDF
ncbi:MAG: translocation protein TolB [Cyclobacteriaceae bacterium]|nr:translocation protein TolB [Cyclobacteriaceae bacterium]